MPRFEGDFLADYSDEEILAELARVAAVTGTGTVTKDDLRTHGRVSHSAVVRHFGSLRVALHRAGLKSARFMKATDEELLDILVELWVRTLETDGRSPRRDDLARFDLPVSDDTIARRFGNWRKALLRAATYAESAEASELAAPARNERDLAVIPTRNGISIRKRFFVLKRDHYTCQICGQSGLPLEVDHVVPVAAGGSDSLDNLQAACLPCNRGKRDSLE